MTNARYCTDDLVRALVWGVGTIACGGDARLGAVAFCARLFIADVTSMIRSAERYREDGK